MIAIYSITNTVNGKRYIGKSKNIEARWWSHRNQMKQTTRKADCNRHLWGAAQKYGMSAFSFEVLESFTDLDEDVLRVRELHWMDHYKSYDREHGYNLRRDSSTKMIVHAETLRLMSQAIKGEKNPNFGNAWSDEQKQSMSLDLQRRRDSGRYGEQWKARIGASQKGWNLDEKRRASVSAKCKLKKHKFNFTQHTRDGELIKRWGSVEEILQTNPTWKWQNIYSVCNGYKPTYQGFIWKKTQKTTQ